MYYKYKDWDILPQYQRFFMLFHFFSIGPFHFLSLPPPPLEATGFPADILEKGRQHLEQAYIPIEKMIRISKQSASTS